MPASCPLTSAEIVELYFMEHRAKLIDLAAFLDRLDRAADGAAAGSDFRVKSFREALAILLQGEPGRAQRVLELFSDPSEEPIPKSPMKGALGAFPGRH